MKVLQPVFFACLVMGVVLASALASCAAAVEGSEFAFTDPESDVERFMAWEASIKLTEEQEQVMKDALGPMPAPCCSDNSAYTCCCPCNLAKTWWGLSKHLIADRDAGVEEVQATVQEWFDLLAPEGFSGNICGTGSCNRALREDGCGGMSAGHVNV